jgi:hypothetical protein
VNHPERRKQNRRDTSTSQKFLPGAYQHQNAKEKKKREEKGVSLAR